MPAPFFFMLQHDSFLCFYYCKQLDIGDSTNWTLRRLNNALILGLKIREVLSNELVFIIRL
jgi:hypothetical protein